MTTKEEIKKLSELARLDLSLEDEEKYIKDFDSILGYIDQLSKAVTESGKKEKDLAELRNVMREDGEPHETGLYTEQILTNMPTTEKGYLKVKKILKQEHE